MGVCEILGEICVDEDGIWLFSELLEFTSTTTSK